MFNVCVSRTTYSPARLSHSSSILPSSNFSATLASLPLIGRPSAAQSCAPSSSLCAKSGGLLSLKGRHNAKRRAEQHMSLLAGGRV